VLGEKPVPVPIFSSHILHEVAPSNQDLRSERRVVLYITRVQAQYKVRKSQGRQSVSVGKTSR
jgi:hypothetical protein